MATARSLVLASYVPVSEEPIASALAVRETAPGGAPKPRLVDRLREAVGHRTSARPTRMSVAAPMALGSSSVRGCREGIDSAGLCRRATAYKPSRAGRRREGVVGSSWCATSNARAGDRPRRIERTVVRRQRRQWRDRPGALLLLVLVLASGCAPVMPVVPARGQPPEQVARDRTECEAQARQSTGSSPTREGLRATLYWTLGGLAVGLGAGAAVLPFANEGGAKPRIDPMTPVYLAAAGAAVGFVVGTLVGVATGADTAKGERRQYEEKFRACLGARGYSVGDGG